MGCEFDTLSKCSLLYAVLEDGIEGERIEEDRQTEKERMKQQEDRRREENKRK